MLQFSMKYVTCLLRFDTRKLRSFFYCGVYQFRHGSHNFLEWQDSNLRSPTCWVGGFPASYILILVRSARLELADTGF